MGWTAPTDRTTGYLVTAVDWNIIEDNLSYLHGDAGSVDLSAGNATYTIRALLLAGSIAGNPALQMKVSGDANPRAQFTAGGVLSFGDGTASVDTVVGRTSAGIFGMSQGNGIGYATGMGGSVTQITSQTTGVTLNKICGQITTVNLSLAAGATAAFTLTNSLIAQNDVIILNGGAISSGFMLQGGCFNGGANIAMTAAGSGSISGTATINFAVIKAAAS